MTLELSELDRQLLEFIREDERRKRLAVSPKMEQARNFPGNIIGARGGRSAGAKTTGIISLNVQESHREFHRVVCLRETQVSLEESLYQAVEEAVAYLQYPGWRFPRSQGYCESPTGSKWIFRGLSNLRAAKATKGLQGFDRFILDEAADVSGESLDILLPTVMKVRGSKLFFAYNPMTETDPIFNKVWKSFQNDPGALLLDMQPGPIDNPWFNEESQKLSDKLKAEDPELWEHVWCGKPLTQGQRSVMARVDVRAAMERKSEESEPEEIGVDVARFGDDKTTFFRRKGLKVVEWKEVSKMDTQEVARMAWEMAKRNREVAIKVDDSGVGGGVTDKLRDLGANVIPILFGGEPMDKGKYTSVADEMWFKFPIDEAEIPDNSELMEELSGRQYTYTSKDQRKIESKADFKKRLGRSPDKADGLILCFYRKKREFPMLFS